MILKKKSVSSSENWKQQSAQVLIFKFILIWCLGLFFFKFMICAILQKHWKFLKIVRFLGEFDIFENPGITVEGSSGYLIEFCCCK